MRVYVVSIFGEDYDYLHGVYSSIDKAKEAKQKLLVMGLRVMLQEHELDSR